MGCNQGAVGGYLRKEINCPFKNFTWAMAQPTTRSQTLLPAKGSMSRFLSAVLTNVGPSLWFSWIPNSLVILVQVIQKMASSSMHRASSSTTSNSRNYDVLSFRGGGDTRRNFTDHLFTTLTAYGIQTLRDDEDNCTL